MVVICNSSVQMVGGEWRSERIAAGIGSPGRLCPLRDNLSQSRQNKMRSYTTTARKRIKLYFHLCTDIFRICRQAAPIGRTGFFSQVRRTGNWKLHGDTSDIPPCRLLIWRQIWSQIKPTAAKCKQDKDNMECIWNGRFYQREPAKVRNLLFNGTIVEQIVSFFLWYISRWDLLLQVFLHSFCSSVCGIKMAQINCRTVR